MLHFIIVKIQLAIRKRRLELKWQDYCHFRNKYTDEEWHNEVFKAAWVGVDMIRLYHSIGQETPDYVYEIYKKIVETDPFGEYDFDEDENEP